MTTKGGRWEFKKSQKIDEFYANHYLNKFYIRVQMSRPVLGSGALYNNCYMTNIESSSKIRKKRGSRFSGVVCTFCPINVVVILRREDRDDSIQPFVWFLRSYYLAYNVPLTKCRQYIFSLFGEWGALNILDFGPISFDFNYNFTFYRVYERRVRIGSFLNSRPLLSLRSRVIRLVNDYWNTHNIMSLTSNLYWG